MTRAEQEALITSLAAEQHGLVTRAQLLAAGISPRVLDRRVAVNRLRPVQRGVYELGPLRSPWAREMAAVLACRERGVVGTVASGGSPAHVSHGSAAMMCELIDRRPIVPVHITIAGANRGRRPGILVHRVAYLEPHEVTMLDGIPITAPMRTLVDLAGTVRHRELERAVARAEDQHLVSRSALLTQMEAYRRRRGTGMLRRILESQNTPVLTRSEAEERFLLLIRKAGLPTPEANTDVADHEVDFLWRRQRLVVEVDGFAYHSSPGRFESDRRRDADLAAIGYRVLRVTWRQMLNEPEKVLVRLAQTLAISIGPPRS